MLNTLIEWAHHTVNFFWGCSKVSPGCANCYALLLSKLFSRGKATWGPAGKRWIRADKAREEVIKIVRKAKAAGVRPRVFVNSMSDTFEDHPALTTARCELLVFLEMFPTVDFLLLTKRPENVHSMVPPSWMQHWPSHVWIGTTVENQETADSRIPELLKIPARIRFLSCEPLLGPVDLSRWTVRGVNLSLGLEGFKIAGIDWVICGGESGQKARPMHPDWARSLRNQCKAAGVPFFFKQWGEWVGGTFDARKGKAMLDDGCIFWANPGHARIHRWEPGDAPQWAMPISGRVGKKAHRLNLAGEKIASNNRLLDGLVHSEFPTS